MPPGQGLAGVAQNSLDIDAGRRTVASVGPVLRDRGLSPATRAEYRQWVDDRMERIIGASTAARMQGLPDGSDPW